MPFKYSILDCKSKYSKDARKKQGLDNKLCKTFLYSTCIVYSLLYAIDAAKADRNPFVFDALKFNTCFSQFMQLVYICAKNPRDFGWT